MRHPQTEPIRPLFDWIYSQSTPQMVHDGPKLAAIIDNEEGLQQGCKLGTFAFCTMSVRPFTRCVSADAIGEHALSVTGIGIVDDFTLIGELDAVMAAFEALSSDPDLADLSMNLQKTAGHWLHNSDPPQAFVDWCSGVGIQFFNDNCIRLGAAFGHRKDKIRQHIDNQAKKHEALFKGILHKSFPHQLVVPLIIY